MAGARSLANLAHSSTINKVKISEEAECVSYLMQQLQSAEMQLKLAARLDSLKSRQSEAHLLTLLEGVLGNSGARSLAKLAHQVRRCSEHLNPVPRRAGLCGLLGLLYTCPTS